MQTHTHAHTHTVDSIDMKKHLHHITIWSFGDVIVFTRAFCVTHSSCPILSSSSSPLEIWNTSRIVGTAVPFLLLSRECVSFEFTLHITKTITANKLARESKQQQQQQQRENLLQLHLTICWMCDSFFYWCCCCGGYSLFSIEIILENQRTITHGKYFFFSFTKKKQQTKIGIMKTNDWKRTASEFYRIYGWQNKYGVVRMRGGNSLNINTFMWST